MKKIILFLIVLIISALCYGQEPPSIVFEDTGEKPVKKIPERQRNFEVIKGKKLKTPIDMNRFAAAAKIALDLVNASSGNTVTVFSEGTGFIHFRIRRTPAWVNIRLCFWEDEYWFEYIESYRFNAIPGANQIHKNYFTFISRIDNDIKKYY
jgi:hypothetical protein